MKIKILLPTLLFILCACEDDKDPATIPATRNTATLHAVMGEEFGTRAAIDDVSNTIKNFASGDRIGLFASKYLRQNNEGVDEADLKEVENVMFQMNDLRKWDDDSAPKLKWRLEPFAEDITATENQDKDKVDRSADIYAYYPYQADLTGGYTIFKDGSVAAGTPTLSDILMAERTKVENNNPAIFLTFKHRFALLKLTLGTGMAGVEKDEVIAAVIDQGMDEKANINMAYVNDRENDVIKLKEGNITEFHPIKRGDEYYIILPCGDFDGPGPLDSIAFTHIRIGNEEPSELAKPLKPQPNMLYNLTVHKGEQGSIDTQLGEIEVWQYSNDIGSVREESGIYSAGDLVNAITLYNSNPSSTNTKLKSYGTWNEDEQYWEFDLLRNIDMKLLTGSTNYSFTNFHGVFNGGGYSITGSDIEGNGLFGTVKERSIIQNLTLTDITVTGTGNTGALAGTVESGVTIHNIKVDGVSTVSSTGGNTGGLIGVSASNITRSSATVEVTSTSGDNIGGLVGSTTGTIDGSFASGRVTSAGNNTGGLVGNTTADITNSYAACKVTGNNQTGGLVGNTTADITNSYAIGTITGNNYVGGLAGQTTGVVTLATADGTVSGDNYVGGLIGSTNKKVNQSSARATVTGTGTVGGLIALAAEGYQPYVPYEKAETELRPVLDDEGNPTYDKENNQIMEEVVIKPEVKEVLESGTLITASYATNGLPLVGASGGTADPAKIVFSYDVAAGTSSEEDSYFSIDLNNYDANEILDALNAQNEYTTVKWILNRILIGGQAHNLPILSNQ